MTDEMKTNIKDINNIQFFMDVTYNIKPPFKAKSKLLILLSLIFLCNISIIESENIETFIKILNYLKQKYDFNPAKISIDFNEIDYLALTTVFPNICFLPLFFSFYEYNNKKIT